MATHGIKPTPARLREPRPGVLPRTPEWDDWVAEIERYIGRPICGGSRTDKTPCCNKKCKGRNRCRRHGGKVPRGPASPHWKHGKASLYANALPERMQEAFETALNDPKLLALESDIAVMEARQVELLDAIRNGLDPAAALREVLHEVGELHVSVAEGNVVGIAMASEAIAEAATSGVATADAWEAFVKAGEHKRKLIETEGRRLERMQAFLTAEEARTRDQVVIGIILRAMQMVSDPAEQRQVLTHVVESIDQLSGGLLQTDAPKRLKEVSVQ